ncbi:MAG: hypothetical protein ABI199_00565 [Bacteroidia bacterium]
MKTKLFFATMCAFLLGRGIANAQFGDSKPYPSTTSPHESKDSTRGHIWGFMFGSDYTKTHADSAKRGSTQYSQVPQGANAFSFQRVYLGYDYFFNKQFSVHMVLAHEDLYDGSIGGVNIDQTNSRSFYLKFGNMEWDNIFPGSNLSIGAVVTPSFAFMEEPFWGYRAIERTILDMRGITGSNDVGAKLGGKIWKTNDENGAEKACVGYNIMVGNNSGAKPDNSALSSYTPYKRYYGDLFAKFFNDKIVVDFYGDYHTIQWSPYKQSNTVGRGLIGYKTKNFNISFEYFQEVMKNQAIVAKVNGISQPNDTTNRVQSGFSIEGAATLLRDKNGVQKLGAIFRYDTYNPDANYSADDTYTGSYSNGNSNTENFITVGLDYTPIPQIHIMPNVWYDQFSNRANGVGGSLKSDYDLAYRITFYYLFYK